MQLDPDVDLDADLDQRKDSKLDPTLVRRQRTWQHVALTDRPRSVELLDIRVQLVDVVLKILIAYIWA